MPVSYVFNSVSKISFEAVALLGYDTQVDYFLIAVVLCCAMLCGSLCLLVEFYNIDVALVPNFIETQGY